MGNLYSSYVEFNSTTIFKKTKFTSSDKLCDSSSTVSCSLNAPITFSSQEEISLLLSNYHVNLSGNKHFRISKNDRNSSGRHIAICQLQHKHNNEVDSYNKKNKNASGFISRKKDVVCEALHYCTYVNTKDTEIFSYFSNK